MRFTNYDKMHDELTKILMECTPPDLGGTWDTYGRGYAAGLHRALYELECQEKFTDWDDRQKLLQPERSDFDWSIVDAMVNGLSDALPNEHEAHGGGLTSPWGASGVVGVRPAFLIATCRKIREEAETCHS